ncbi:RsiV family protein [Pseudomonas citronellolis]|uniref:RsiV family protein n=1 Tax=Pseudomonas citronellolis TaxID=53408 RepID=UPI0023E3659F|nr:RsiV family protein [Pseudomonas citronellolis]MDF3933619.1 RsiV family protein [Pseudomonas citronellolis]
MHLVKMLATATLALSLSGCQSLFGPGLGDPLSARHTSFEHQQPGCQGEQCPLFNLDTLSFDDEPALNAAIEKQLLDLTRETPDSPRAASLASYEKQFLDGAEPGWSSYLQAKVREQHDGLVILELSSYAFTGGEYGKPGRAFINYDRRLHKVLELQDVLLPGQEQAFWDNARLAHQAWVVQNKLVEQDPNFIKDWPFQQTPHFALTFGALTLKYDIDRIAPHSVGHPELKIPYPRLNGIVKPYYFPGRGAQ